MNHCRGGVGSTGGPGVQHRVEVGFTPFLSLPLSRPRDMVMVGKPCHSGNGKGKKGETEAGA